MFNPGATLYSQAFGSVPASLGFPVYVSSAPTSTTTQGPFGPFQIGQVAVWPNNGVFQLIGLSTAGGILSATWVQLSSSSGTILAINGTAAQITASTSAGTTTLSLPAAITAPGSLTTTTTLTSGTTISAGSTITAGTGITSTAGNITATNGNLVLSTPGNKIDIATGADASTGTTASMTGTPGTVTVTSTAVTLLSIILFSRATTGGTPGQVSISAQSAGSFTLLSTGNETSTFNYLIIN